MAQAFIANPELKQSSALTAAARENKSGATYGPLIPALNGQAFFGGLGGGRDGVSDTFGGQQDYFVGASWRIGPGGLFDFSRIKASESRLKAAKLGAEKLKDDLIRQVVEASTRCQSLEDQVELAKRILATAEEALRLTQQRKEFGVGVVLVWGLIQTILVPSHVGAAQITARRLTLSSSSPSAPHKCGV